ncbi:MAG: GNAT family N-acetyltransferase [Thermoguttaceae bacterium]|jgi:CBS domain-containing protein
MVPRLDPRAEESTIYRKPRAFITKKGEAILIRMLDEKICQSMIAMYLAFQPRNSFQGLPPVTDEACTKWVQHMIGNGINIVALSFGDGAVGHAALFPMDNEVCEMFVVVSPPFQNTGIGTQLTRCSVQLAYEIGFDRIWLPVECTNVRARHVYKKCGFENLPGRDLRELDMSLDLKRYHKLVQATVSGIMNRNVIIIRHNQSCKDALEIFVNQRVASLPVVDEQGELMGIISETDLMFPSNIARNVSDIETMEVVTVREDCTIAKVVRMFESKRIRCIPVVDGHKKLVGVVGRKDVLAYYAKHL